MTPLVLRVAARYKKKLRSDEGNDIYVYSERQVALRNKKKAERLEKLRKSVHKLRARVKKDLRSGDSDKVLTALVVGLMDHTAERVGNDESKEERGHVGVTGWQKSHVSFGKGKATIKYTGKSGVKQKKVVTEKALVSALKKAHEDCKEGDLFCHDGGRITAAKVNEYLAEFEITAKDLRGLHANSRMQDNLKAIRSKGGDLPTDAKKRKAQLKKEFKEALELTAEDVGHEASTLKNQYLVPGLEDEFMKGKVMDKMVKTAEAVAERFLAGSTRTALVRTIDATWVEKLRKDFLVLMKNLPRVNDYSSANQLREAFKVYRKNFRIWVFDEFLNPQKERDDASFDGLRKPAWDFYAELEFPLGYPSDDYTDHYNGKDVLFQRFVERKDKWEQRLRTKAQACWKTFKYYLDWRTEKKVDVELPNEDRLVLEGFQVEVVGYNPKEGSWQDDAFSRCREALRLYRRKAKAMMPWLLQKQLPLVLTFNGKLDQGGVYETTHIVISLSALINQPPEWGAHMLAHEMGHHLYKSLSQQAKTYWNAAIRQDYGPISLAAVLDGWPENERWTDDHAKSLAASDPILSLQLDLLSRERGGNAGWEQREHFQRAMDDGQTTVAVPKHPITGYAGKNPEESFCEAIGRIVGYGPRTVLAQIREWLETVIPGMIKTAEVTL